MLARNKAPVHGVKVRHAQSLPIARPITIQ
jgi:hypothetical protein